MECENLHFTESAEGSGVASGVEFGETGFFSLETEAFATSACSEDASEPENSDPLLERPSESESLLESTGIAK
jgi:hypothetical protein